MIFRPLTFSTRPPQASNPSRRSERHNAAASHVQSSSFKAREISTPLHTSSRLFPLSLHFETSPREPSTAESTSGNAESWSSTSWLLAASDLHPLFPLNASFCSGDQASSVRGKSSSSSRSNQGTATAWHCVFTRCHAPILNSGAAVAVTREGTWPRPLEEGDKRRLRPLTLGCEP